MADLTTVEDVITDVTFENCHIVGPAVVFLLGQTSIDGLSVDEDLPVILWPVDDERSQVAGAVGMVDCKISGCRFSRIGLAVKRSELAQFEHLLGG